MRKLIFLLSTSIFFFALQISDLLSQPSVEADHPGLFHTIEKEYPNSRIDGYNLYIPKSYEASKENFPVIVFLQGGLGVGGDVDRIFNWGIAKMLVTTQSIKTELDRLRANTFIYVMPHIEQGQFYENSAAIETILREVKAAYRIDENRIYLTGLSRGGHGTWGVASRLNDEFAAIAPVCGALHGVKDFSTLTNLPIWVAHNPADRVVDYENSRKAVTEIEALTKQRFHQSSTIAAADYQQHQLIFTSSENAAKPHDAWTEMYSNANFYKWLLRFEKEK